MTAATRWLLALAVAAGASGPTCDAHAQSQSSWELIGIPYRNGMPTTIGGFSDMAFSYGTTANLDTLYVSSGTGMWRRDPGMGVVMNDFLDYRDGERMIRTREGYLIKGSRSGAGGDGSRSTDSGRTWQYDVITIPVRYNGLPVERGCGVVALLQSTLPALGGAVYVGCGPEVWRSFQGGAFHTWSVIGEPGGELRELREMPPSAILPQGRLVAGSLGLISYSDDGGTTWTAGFNGPTIVEELALAPDAAHPYGGTLYAGGLEFGRGPDPRASVYASDDGGASWQRRHAFVDNDFMARPGAIALIVGPDGALYGGLRQVVGGPAPDLGTVVRSRDGGVTWESVAAGYGGWAVNGFAVGRDRRLYLVSDRGLWRTVDPIAVAGESVPGDAASEIVLSVRPNPSAGRVEVVLSLAAAGAVRVVVADALGREVAVVLDGAAAKGETAVGVETGAWPAGVYVVRATVGTQVASARLVVVR